MEELRERGRAEIVEELREGERERERTEELRLGERKNREWRN